MPPIINTEIEKEKSLFERIEDSLKATLFKIFFILSKNSEAPFWKAVVFHILELIQLLSFPLALSVISSADRHELEG